MKLVMTLLVRDEADIVDAQVAFHLHAGVDFVIATDHRSQDGTPEILERYEREGRLRLIREDGVALRQAEWVNRMARLAATEHGADWVLNTDADEFWWPRAGSLKDVLATVPARFGVVRGCWRHFPPRPDDGGLFSERMTVRLARPADPGDKTSIYHAHQKVAHRAGADVVVERGNHNADGAGLLPWRSWFPIEVLHFSLRGREQLERKGRAARDEEEERQVLHKQLLDEASRTGRTSAYLASFTVDDDALEEGLRSGRLATDTRLRDALRRIRADDGTFAAPAPGGRGGLVFRHPTVCDDAGLAAEVAPLMDIDGVVRAAERVDALEARLARLERKPLARLRRLAR